MSVSAIIPAAGSGTRMNHSKKKPYILLDGKPILVHTLKKISSTVDISEIIITVHPGEEGFCETGIVRGLSLPCPVKVVPGGEARQDSVRNALSFLSDNSEYVLIHDGARPLISERLVQAVINETIRKRAVTAAVPVKDTITSVYPENNQMERVLPRENLYAVQTPQCFEKALVIEAHRKAVEDGFYGTDDASLVMRLGVAVSVVKGDYENIKITTPEDLVIAEAMLGKDEK